MKIVFQLGYIHSGKTRLRIDRFSKFDWPNEIIGIGMFCSFLIDRVLSLYISPDSHPKVWDFLINIKQKEIINHIFSSYCKTRDWNDVLKFVPNVVYLNGEISWIPDIIKYDIQDIYFEVCYRDFRVAYTLSNIDTKISIDDFISKNNKYHEIFMSIPKDKIIWVKFEDYILNRSCSFNKYLTKHDFKKINNNKHIVESINYNCIQEKLSLYNNLYEYEEGIMLDDIIKK